VKIAIIKKLVESYTIEQLTQAEIAMENGEPLLIDIEGDDDGEQFTHILAAIDILFRVKKEHKEVNVALREFAQRVRSTTS
jgi:hypothetical protein